MHVRFPYSMLFLPFLATCGFFQMGRLRDFEHNNVVNIIRRNIENGHKIYILASKKNYAS
jgi:hypothetical protein